MDPVGIHRTHILILNYNGRALLAECLPSVVAAAAASPVLCALSVIDNGSTDDSLAYLNREWPAIGVISRPNRGLASFNDVLASMDEAAVLLLNNDVKLEPDAVGSLLRALDAHPDAFFSAPKCWDFDGRLYEGMRTRVRLRFGLIQGMCRVPGHETQIDRAGLTASAGPILAVDRVKFLSLGGYDPIYFPGRIEDLDLGFRGWMAGWRGYYVPESVAYHRGFGSFLPSFGQDGCAEQPVIRLEESVRVPPVRSSGLAAGARGARAGHGPAHVFERIRRGARAAPGCDCGKALARRGMPRLGGT